MHRDKSCLLFLSLARAPFAQIPIKSRVFDTQGHTGVFDGGVDKMGAALQLHKDKEELVRGNGPMLHKSPPPPRFVLGGLIHVQSGSWEDEADEPSSPFTRCNVMRTRCPSASGNHSQFCNLALMDRNITGQVDTGNQYILKLPRRGSCFDHKEQHDKRCSGCVTHTLALLSIFSPNKKPFNCEEGESTRDTKNNDCLFAMCARVHILCVFLKIRLGDKPGPFYCS